MDAAILTVIILAALLLRFKLLPTKKKRTLPALTLPDDHRKLLQQHNVNYWEYLYYKVSDNKLEG